MVSKRLNITVEEEIYEEFLKHASKQGIKVSTWIGAQMNQFNDEQQMLEEYRKEKRS
ncbi:hypothetical protein [Carnobacterium antarcticum]|uniref:Antitoxin n=1 Tax=Carnobacterium antarcticum TaxID=2126436 RepID=A0ABW4NNH5_9LACT|nr:hypothetical protein [Carnobacterium sp. CP1]ALV21073.1 hypothetical protein NY10_453 [Carnobacterium sp. CP1]